jgi:hypothetical protein
MIMEQVQHVLGAQEGPVSRLLSSCPMDATPEEVLGVKGSPSDRSSESAGPAIRNSRLRVFAILGIAQIPPD